MIFIKIILVLFALMLVWHFSTRWLINPYKLIMIFGKKGSGKSTLGTKIMYKALIQGKKVYSTEKLEFTYKKKHYETIIVDPCKIYEYKFEEGSVILLDEINTYTGYDNRQFKAMDPKIIEWFRFQRHYKVIVYLMSQSFDIDRKLRNLTDSMYIVSKFARALVIARRLIRKPVVVHPTGDSPARLDDDIVEDGLLLAPFGGCMLAWIPRWVKLFDSFQENHNFVESPISGNTARCESGIGKG